MCSVCDPQHASVVTDVLALAVTLLPVVLRASLPALTWLLCELLNRYDKILTEDDEDTKLNRRSHEDISYLPSESTETGWSQSLVAGLSTIQYATSQRLKEYLDVNNTQKKRLQSDLDRWIRQTGVGLVVPAANRMFRETILPAILDNCHARWMMIVGHPGDSQVKLDPKITFGICGSMGTAISDHANAISIYSQKKKEQAIMAAIGRQRVLNLQEEAEKRKEDQESQDEDDTEYFSS